jgi:hypothetical protein
LFTVRFLEIYNSNVILVNTTSFEVTISTEGDIPAYAPEKKDQDKTNIFLILIGVLGGLIVILVLTVKIIRI